MVSYLDTVLCKMTDSIQRLASLLGRVIFRFWCIHVKLLV